MELQLWHLLSAVQTMAGTAELIDAASLPGRGQSLCRLLWHERAGLWGDECIEAQIFVACLGASNYTYAEATASQRTEDWIGSHQRAFEYFGGVPKVVVPDNLKSGVSQACHHEPGINRQYHAWAEHYGVAVIPARPNKPRDKAKVEKAVQTVERQILAPCRNQRFTSLAQLNEAIRLGINETQSTTHARLQSNAPGTV
jgi:transposase